MLAFVVLHEIHMSKVVALQRLRHEIQTSHIVELSFSCIGIPTRDHHHKLLLNLRAPIASQALIQRNERGEPLLFTSIATY
jgi:hypothetical protein